MRIAALIGYPGSGKGTQALLLEERMGFHPLSTGEYIRNMAKTDEEVKKRYEAGIPQPDEVIVPAVKSQLKNLDPEIENIVLDSFPHSVGQARKLSEIIKELKISEPIVFLVKISEEEVKKRISIRKVCSLCHTPIFPGSTDETDKCKKCGGKITTRSDDDSETVERRIKEDRERLEGLTEYYKKLGALIAIDGMKSVEEVYGQIAKNLA